MRRPSAFQGFVCPSIAARFPTALVLPQPISPRPERAHGRGNDGSGRTQYVWLISEHVPNVRYRLSWANDGGSGPNRRTGYKSICIPSSTTRPGGKPKYVVAGRAFREMNENKVLRQVIIGALPVVSNVSRPRK